MYEIIEHKFYVSVVGLVATCNPPQNILWL